MTVQEARERGIRKGAYEADEANVDGNRMARLRGLGKQLEEAEKRLGLYRALIAEQQEKIRKMQDAIAILAEGMRLAWGDDWMIRMKEAQ